MRVLHVAECAGGVERYLCSFLRYSSCENILILSQLYEKSRVSEFVDKIEIMHMKHGIGLCAIKEAFELRKKVKKYKPDIVYAHSSIAGAITRMACLGLNVKVVYNPHGWSFNMESRKKVFFILLEKLMSHFCDAIICISEAEMVSAMNKKICNKNKLHVIYNGIDIESYTTECAEMNIPEKAFVVGMVGRICRQKAPDIFVKMAGKVNEKVDNVYFVIVGDVLEGMAEEREEIEDLARNLKINLIITGWVDNPLAYMNRFDVGCLLSRWEGFGLAIPEYMLAGIPVVATNVDAIPYLIKDNETGMLVEKDDWETAAQKVLDLKHDETLRNKIIANGNRTVRERFDAKRVSKECENLFHSLLIR